jgi:hypothetical protein
MSSSKKERDARNTSSSERNSPIKKASSSFKRRSTNTSQHMANGKHRNELNFVRVVKPTDEEVNFRKTKTSIEEPNKIRNALMESEKVKNKIKNSEKLLESIIQSRCLTKDQERMNSGSQRNKKEDFEQNDYYDNKAYLEERPNRVKRKDSKLRKSFTSNKERESENSSKKEHKEESTSKDKIEDEIDKPWISYLRNLRIPMM